MTKSEIYPPECHIKYVLSSAASAFISSTVRSFPADLSASKFLSCFSSCKNKHMDQLKDFKTKVCHIEYKINLKDELIHEDGIKLNQFQPVLQQNDLAPKQRKQCLWLICMYIAKLYMLFFVQSRIIHAIYASGKGGHCKAK